MFDIIILFDYIGIETGNRKESISESELLEIQTIPKPSKGHFCTFSEGVLTIWIKIQ